MTGYDLTSVKNKKIQVRQPSCGDNSSHRQCYVQRKLLCIGKYEEPLKLKKEIKVEIWCYGKICWVLLLNSGEKHCERRNYLCNPYRYSTPKSKAVVKTALLPSHLHQTQTPCKLSLKKLKMALLCLPEVGNRTWLNCLKVNKNALAIQENESKHANLWDTTCTRYNETNSPDQI